MKWMVYMFKKWIFINKPENVELKKTRINDECGSGTCSKFPLASLFLISCWLIDQLIIMIGLVIFMNLARVTMDTLIYLFQF